MFIQILKIITLAATSLLAVNTQLATAASHDHEAAEAREKIDYQLSISYGRDQLKFDVAESGPKFVFDEAPILDSGLPAYGNSFVTQGYIYPHGTLDASNGVFADGSPEFPDKVIGVWTCRGFFIGNGAETETGPWTITTQHYDFYSEAGYAEGKQGTRLNLVTDGYELVDIGVVGKRPITGGTGQFKRAKGEAEQMLLGFNASEGVNLRFDISVK